MPVISSEYQNEHYASFATTSRLVTCLVSEALVPVYFVPSADNELVGICALLRPTVKNTEKLGLDDILTVVPLRGLPVLNQHSVLLNGIRCSQVDLVDFLDMEPHIYSVRQGTAQATDAIQKKTLETLKSVLSGNEEFELVDGFSAPKLWEQFADDLEISQKLREQIGQELGSSIAFQKHTYDNPKPLPTLESSTIQWEQSVVEGHATHPMHKSRKSFPPMPPLIPGSYDLDHPNVRLVGLPKSSAVVRGEYEELSAPLMNALMDAGSDHKKIRAQYPDHTYIAIHELQIPNVQERFKDAVVFPEEYQLPVEALASLRSVARPDILPGLSVKLCLGIKISSALRTVTPFTTYFGPGFSFNVVPKLTYDSEVLAIERELGTITYNCEDTDRAKHCSSVIREALEYDPKYKDDLFIPCGALAEKIQRPDTDETLVSHVWNLDTKEKRIEFFDRYVDLALRSFLPPCLTNGVAFEAHGQNTLARFDRKTGLLKGFVIRDFGGVKAHNETLKKSAGVELDILPDSCVEAQSLEEVFKLLYHTLFHCQLQRLVRVLDLHYTGEGWEIVRKYLNLYIPKDHVMWPMFMETAKVPGKCLVRMKIDELYRDYIYRPVPNMIHYEPQSIPT
ncbi:IucC family-domain-containing protein [Sporodiniella umbellata]|nr:IucC family-domain-containing protein [Sporodiniella umbellata]